MVGDTRFELVTPYRVKVVLSPELTAHDLFSLRVSAWRVNKTIVYQNENLCHPNLNFFEKVW